VIANGRVYELNDLIGRTPARTSSAAGR
jgi:hypothetical protein